MSEPAFLPAFTAALDAVATARRAGLRTGDGASAEPELERLRAALVAERDAAVARGTVDRAAIGAMVRDVARWYPESQVKLIVALGAIASAGA